MIGAGARCERPLQAEGLQRASHHSHLLDPDKEPTVATVEVSLCLVKRTLEKIPLRVLREE
jgi:hypothetical protein